MLIVDFILSSPIFYLILFFLQFRNAFQYFKLERICNIPSYYLTFYGSKTEYNVMIDEKIMPCIYCKLPKLFALNLCMSYMNVLLSITLRKKDNYGKDKDNWPSCSR